MTGQRIGPYQITERLGRGGIGEVWAGVDTMLGRTVAIKVLRSEFSQDKLFVDRFRAEAVNLARLHHPNITTIFTLLREQDQFYLVMELVRGRTLEDILRRGGRLDATRCRAVMTQVIAGFDYAHRMGLIHRDIKPANLMVTDQGLVKIMDFGIARLRGSERLTRQGEVVGTLAYMAPEQLKGAEGDERSDLYSLGVVLYEMISGRVPFEAASEYELMRAQVEMPPPPLASLIGTADPGIEAALTRVLAKLPEQRYASMAAFGRALGPLPAQGEAEAILQQLIDLFAAPPAASAVVGDGSDGSQATLLIDAATVAAGTGPAGSWAKPTVIQPSAEIKPTVLHSSGTTTPPPAAAHRRSRLVPMLVLGGAAAVALIVLGGALADYLTGGKLVTLLTRDRSAAPEIAAVAPVALPTLAPSARTATPTMPVVPVVPPQAAAAAVVPAPAPVTAAPVPRSDATDRCSDQVRAGVRTGADYGRTVFKYHSALSIADLWQAKGALMSASDQARVPLFRNQAMTLKEDAGRKLTDYQRHLQEVSACAPDVLEPIYAGIAAMDLPPEQRAALALFQNQVETVRAGHPDREAMRAEMDRTLATDELWKP